MNTNTNSKLKIISIVFTIVILIGIGIFYWQNQQKSDQVEEQDELISQLDATLPSSENNLESNINNTIQNESTSTTKTPQNYDERSAEQENGIYSSIQYINDGTKYENLLYRFSIVLPSSWGTVQEKTEESLSDPIIQTISLTAENDAERFIKINVVKTEDKDHPLVLDAPHTYLIGNSTWSFYYAGSGDYAGRLGFEDEKYTNILEEVNSISQTFEIF